jgi:hypothetical protein
MVLFGVGQESAGTRLDFQGKYITWKVEGGLVRLKFSGQCRACRGGE